MKKSIIFPNPPITEALLDVKVTLPKDVEVEKLASLHEIIKDRFPIKKARHAMKGGVKLKAGVVPEITSSSDKIDGYLFYSSDGKKIVQARLDGFTFNKLKPYSNWEEFSSEAKDLWQQYVKISTPISVVRVALRYINRIILPLPFIDFKDYILTIPEIAPGLPNELATFFARLVIPKTEIKAIALVTETMEDIGPESKVLPFIFDIDVSRNITIEPNSEDIWRVLDELRLFKNEIFMKSLTEKAKELFK